MFTPFCTQQGVATTDEETCEGEVADVESGVAASDQAAAAARTHTGSAKHARSLLQRLRPQLSDAPPLRGAGKGGAAPPLTPANSLEPAAAAAAAAGAAAAASDEAEDECTICLCAYEAGEVLKRLPCSHVYHEGCIDTWLVKSATCPLCKHTLW